MTLREKINQQFNDALKNKDKTLVSTLRLILASIKERDISNRTKGNKEEVKEQEIKNKFLAVMQEINKAGYDELYFEDIKTVMQNNELDLTDKKLGTWLRDTFGAPRRTSSGRIYSIEDMQR